ncbi:hypothetical protein VNI00_016591 [Paramarasmius palmivorus]|uniref:DNA 3'-5' helicase n=1 Tax=Paramarasmius palmivorus TaxID=297713 RepID=A0AAW0BB36_9AGAR
MIPFLPDPDTPPEEWKKTQVFIHSVDQAMMGTDIPDIEVVIQFGLPQSLEIYTQRAGRAGCTTTLRARAIMLVPKSAYVRINKKKRKKGKATVQEPESEVEMEILAGESFSELQTGVEDGYVPPPPAVLSEIQDDIQDGKEWKMKVEPSLRRYIMANGGSCRRQILNVYFNNPPQTSRVDDEFEARKNHEQRRSRRGRTQRERTEERKKKQREAERLEVERSRKEKEREREREQASNRQLAVQQRVVSEQRHLAHEEAKRKKENAAAAEYLRKISNPKRRGRKPKPPPGLERYIAEMNLPNPDTPGPVASSSISAMTSPSMSTLVFPSLISPEINSSAPIPTPSRIPFSPRRDRNIIYVQTIDGITLIQLVPDRILHLHFHV